MTPEQIVEKMVFYGLNLHGKTIEEYVKAKDFTLDEWKEFAEYFYLKTWQ